jgi:hypothetical protein
VLRVARLLVVDTVRLDEERGHDRDEERDERDTEVDDDASEHAPPRRLWDDVSVPDRSQGRERPPDADTEGRKVSTVDEMGDQAGQDGDAAVTPTR